jgi:hypothetical protein
MYQRNPILRANSWTITKPPGLEGISRKVNMMDLPRNPTHIVGGKNGESQSKLTRTHKAPQDFRIWYVRSDIGSAYKSGFHTVFFTGGGVTGSGSTFGDWLSTPKSLYHASQPWLGVVILEKVFLLTFGASRIKGPNPNHELYIWTSVWAASSRRKIFWRILRGMIGGKPDRVRLTATDKGAFNSNESA